MNGFARLTGLTFLTATVLACSSRGVAPTDGVGSSAAAIVHGELDDPPKYGSVVLVTTNLGTGFASCTGVMLTPHLVATARHCLTSLSADRTKFGTPYDLKWTDVSVWPYDPKAGPAAGKVFAEIEGSEKLLKDADFALIVTKSPLPGPFAPIRLASAPTVGEDVAVAGFGWTDVDTVEAKHDRFRREGLKILALGPDAAYSPRGLGAKELEIGESVCQGDSGAPVFDQATGALLGVAVDVTNGYEPTSTDSPVTGCVDRPGSPARSAVTRVDAYADVIRKAARSLGETLWEEGQPQPSTDPGPAPGTMGGFCQVAADCKTLPCVDFGDSSICTQACDASKPCPDGLTCEGGYCARPAPPPPPVADAGSSPSAAPGGSSSKGCSTSAGSAGLGPALLVALVACAFVRRRG